MLVSMSEMMFQLVALVLQRVEGLVLDLPAAPRTGLRLGRLGVRQRQVRDPGPEVRGHPAVRPFGGVSSLSEFTCMR